MSNALHGRAVSQAGIDQRSREARRHLEDIEAHVVSGIRTSRWWSCLRLRGLILRIYRSTQPATDHCMRN